MLSAKRVLVQVTKQEYASQGWRKLTSRLAADLKEKGHRPYVIPVGGSNALGTWGYLECTNEIRQQEDPQLPFTDIVVVHPNLFSRKEPTNQSRSGMWQWSDSGRIGIGHCSEWSTR